MIYSDKEKLDKNSEISLQIIPSNCADEITENTTVDCIIELSLEERKHEASKPIYIKRI